MSIIPTLELIGAVTASALAVAAIFSRFDIGSALVAVAFLAMDEGDE